MFENKKLLKRIFIETNAGTDYIIFTHEDKTWIIPDANRMPGLNMYQPTTIRGKILRKSIYYFRKNSFLQSGLGLEMVKLSIGETVLKYIESIAKQKNFYIAGYMGDTSSEQNDKATLQIYDDNHIIGYIKITGKETVAAQFEKEIRVIRELKSKGIDNLNLPDVSEMKQSEDLFLFFQTSEKRLSEQVRFSFGEKQIRFIDRLVQSTKVETAYEETDFCDDVEFLKTKLNDFDEKEKNIINKAVSIVENKMKNNRCEVSFSHGDYTLWNVYYTKGKLHAFDFEYCSNTMPAYTDLFHYLTQLSLLGKQNGVGKTIHLYKKYRKKMEKYFVNPDFIYLCYLIHIVSFYLKRTEVWNETAAGYNEKRIGIMEYLVGKVT